MIRVTEAAALSSARWMGKGDSGKPLNDAVSAMHKVLGSISFSGKIVIGPKHESDENLLSVGQQVGGSGGMEVDLALEPLESVNSVAFGRSNAMAVVAMAPKDCLLKVPKIYMDKIAVGAA